MKTGIQSNASTEKGRALLLTVEKEMATHSSILAWRIPGTAEPGGLPSVGLQSRTRLKRLGLALLFTEERRLQMHLNLGLKKVVLPGGKERQENFKCQSRTQEPKMAAWMPDLAQGCGSSRLDGGRFSLTKAWELKFCLVGAKNLFCFLKKGTPNAMGSVADFRQTVLFSRNQIHYIFRSFHKLATNIRWFKKAKTLINTPKLRSIYFHFGSPSGISFFRNFLQEVFF